MGLIEDELQEVRSLCEHLINGSRLVSCVPTMVRVEIKRTSFKHLVICVQFPEDYPKSPILLELKSKSISEKLLDKLTTVCEVEARKYLGKPQILKTLEFVRNFIDENPLSCCYDEITLIKSYLKDGDEFKLKQKNSSIHFKITQAHYYFKGKIFVPDDYPVVAIRLEEAETNFPHLFHRYFLAQAKEIARQCIEPPILKNKKGGVAPPFKPSPSLLPVFKFLIHAVKTLPNELCQLCHSNCFPENPENVEMDEAGDRHVERVYCGHLFHLQCLIKYMKTPPFQGGKKCPSCGQRIYHEKWKVSEKLAENRWAHQQARERELKEVEEFFL